MIWRPTAEHYSHSFSISGDVVQDDDKLARTESQAGANLYLYQVRRNLGRLTKFVSLVPDQIVFFPNPASPSLPMIPPRTVILCIIYPEE